MRHAESIGNLADAAAHHADSEALDLEPRDADVPLSETGEEQAVALGRWLLTHGRDAVPDLVVSSPYRRAADTARVALETGGDQLGIRPELVFDERLRERDLGVFDGLTGRGIRTRYPDEADRRRRLGKFYYQPPSGESWVDVVLRVRSLLHDLEHVDAQHVWLVSHQAVIMAHRFVLEGLDEAAVLASSRDEPLPNVSRTLYERDDQRMVLRAFADTTPVDRADTEVTREPTRSDDAAG